MRGEFPLSICVICYTICLSVFWFPAFTYSVLWSKEASKQQYFSFAYINQIPRDWRKEPFTSILVTN